MPTTLNVAIPGTTDSITFTPAASSTVALVLMAVAMTSFVVRRFSRDKLEIKRDSKEGQLLDIMLKERNEALQKAEEAMSQRATDAHEIGRLSAEVQGLSRLNHRLAEEVQTMICLNEKMKVEVETMRAEIAALREHIERQQQQHQQDHHKQQGELI